MKNCLKCGHQRLPSDQGSELECPKCGAIYAKVEAALAEKRRVELNQAHTQKNTSASKTKTTTSSKKKIFLIAFLLIAGSALFAWSTNPDYIENKLAERRLLSVAKENLLDPESANFRNLKVAKLKYGNDGTTKNYALCGEMNAKNKFGAYTGFEKFAVGNNSAGKPELYTQKSEKTDVEWLIYAGLVGCET
ncbi:hypothetical protein H8K33_18965 [Undibacterium amnicola]|uniref:Zinc ribbon domain-containing protein n=1 Tax=Undibacterium amnicola TaxID=1834038 RepID=A0ABR6XVU2_9BURK|nr:hypothetical protein [Undibacterium amnicola]MBC3833595.1 hypothetical protein [Undibacterium amnicola]